MNICESESPLMNCIDKMKTKLIETAKNDGFDSEKTISYSQKLDELIIKHMKYCYNNNINILINSC